MRRSESQTTTPTMCCAGCRIAAENERLLRVGYPEGSHGGRQARHSIDRAADVARAIACPRAVAQRRWGTLVSETWLMKKPAGNNFANRTWRAGISPPLEYRLMLSSLPASCFSPFSSRPPTRPPIFPSCPTAPANPLLSARTSPTGCTIHLAQLERRAPRQNRRNPGAAETDVTAVSMAPATAMCRGHARARHVSSSAWHLLPTNSSSSSSKCPRSVSTSAREGSSDQAPSTKPACDPVRYIEPNDAAKPAPPKFAPWSVRVRRRSQHFRRPRFEFARKLAAPLRTPPPHAEDPLRIVRSYVPPRSAHEPRAEPLPRRLPPAPRQQRHQRCLASRRPARPGPRRRTLPRVRRELGNAPHQPADPR